MINYIKNNVSGIYGLMQGMYITLLNFFRPKVTEKYPENRGKTFPHQRMRGELIMIHDENNQNRCTACLLCMNNCPNGSIQITVKNRLDQETGKEKKVLDTFMYDLGSCTFCDLCTSSCPQHVIKWSQHFEHAVFTRGRLYRQLNKK